MFASFKIIKVENDIITVQYDGGSGILDGLIEYNIATKKHNVIKYSSQDKPNGVFVKWLMNKPVFKHFAKECYENNYADNKRRVICCG